MGQRLQKSRRRALGNDWDDEDSASPQDEQFDPLAEVAMHDLGLARRDDITTRDNARRARVHLPTLLRNREVNVEGSKAAEKASENRDALNAWNNPQRIKGGRDGPDLADMNRGQEHRAELSRAVKIAKQEMADAGLDVDAIFLHDHHDGRRQHRNNQNDRGRADKYGGARGSARPSGRPLDPAVDQNRDYTYRKAPTPYANAGGPTRGLAEGHRGAVGSTRGGTRGNLDSTRASTRGGHHGTISRQRAFDPAKLATNPVDAVAPSEILASADDFWNWCDSLRGIESAQKVEPEPSSISSIQQPRISDSAVLSPTHESVTVKGDNFTDGLLTPVSNTAFSSPGAVHEAVSGLGIQDTSITRSVAETPMNPSPTLLHTNDTAQSSKDKLVTTEVVDRVGSRRTNLKGALPRNPFGNESFLQAAKAHAEIVGRSITSPDPRILPDITESQIGSDVTVLRERDGNAQGRALSRWTNSPTDAAEVTIDPNPTKSILGQQHSRGRSTTNKFLESRWADSSPTRGTSRQSRGFLRTRAGPGLAILTADLEAAGISIADLQASAARQAGRPILNSSMVQIEPDHQRSSNQAVFRSRFTVESGAVPATSNDARTVVPSGSSSISRRTKPTLSYPGRLNFGTYRDSIMDADSSDSEL